MIFKPQVRYGNYHKIDPMFGTENSLKKLIKEAKKYNIHVILDGVFSHTGDDSIYFNKYGRYDSIGAYQSKDSPYYDWYTFNNWNDDYVSWWGIKTLPEVNENNDSYINFITGKNGVITHWQKQALWDGVWMLLTNSRMNSLLLLEIQ